MTPKQRFLLRPEAEYHLKIAHTDPFLTALDFSMLEIVDRLPTIGPVGESTQSTALANAYRVEGARLYRSIVENIADKPVESKPEKPAFDYRTT